MPPELDEGPPLPPEEWTLPWRQLAAWVASAFVVAWALVLLPGAVRDIRIYAGIDSLVEEPLEIPPFPEDPVLSPKVIDLMARGKAAERDGKLVEARQLYFKAFKAEPKCFSCALRRRVVERLIREECVEALGAGAKYLEESRFGEAAQQYRKVLALVPDEKARFHVLAEEGLATARTAAKRSGRPIP